LENFVVADRWQQMTDMGVGRSDYGFSFAANGKGYVGITSAPGAGKEMSFWEYDPGSNVWSQKQDFGDGFRIDATGFGIGSKGYVIGGFGYNQQGISVRNDHVWEYDPASNNWTKKNDFNNGARDAAASFTIGLKAYIGTGNSKLLGKLNDLWEYNPAEDKWTRKADLPGDPRFRAFGFSIAANGYIGGGDLGNGVLSYSFYEYNPALDQWSQKSDLPAEDTFIASNSFSSSKKGYVGGLAARLWQFDPSRNSWSRKADLPSDVHGIGFTIGEYGYMGSLYDKTFYRYIIE
jgi:N-acetylneuraminic acid mutarotase